MSIKMPSQVFCESYENHLTLLIVLAMDVINGSLKIFLASVGVISDPRFKFLQYFLCFVFVCMYVLLFLGEIIAFVSPIDNIYRVEIGYQSLCFLYIGLTELVSKFNQNRLLKICDRVSGSVPDFIVPAAQQKAEAAFKNVMKIFVLLYFSSIAVYISAPLLNFALSRQFDDPLSYPLPYWFANIRISSTMEYLCMTLVQNILCATIFCVYALSFVFIICMSISCKSHVNELAALLAEFTENADDVEETDLMFQLKDLISYQHKLSCLFQDIAKYLEQIFSLALAWFMLVAVLTLFMAVQISSDTVFVIKILSVVSNVIISFFFFCIVAENMTDMNETIVKQFYSLPWYHRSVEFQKILHILLMQSRHQLEMKAFGMYRIDVRLFSTSIRTIYSLLNIIFLSLRKKSVG